MLQRPEWLRPPRGVRWSATLGVAAAATVLLGAFGAWAFLGVAGSLLTFGSGSDPSQSLADALKRHTEIAQVSTKRFDGRSAFFTPPAPVRKPPKPTKPPEPPKPPPPPPPPPVPREYTGPKPVGAIGGLIFFADSSQIRVGEERGGVKVISSSAPWSVKLAHGGGEYDVPFWMKGREEFFNNSDWKSIKNSTPGIEPAKGDQGGRTPAGGPTASAPTVPGTPPTPVTVPPPVPGAPERVGPGMAAAPGSSGANAWTTEHMAPPPPLDAGRIEGMSQADAQSALQAVARARMNRNLDQPTRDRLNQEFQQLSDRMKALAKGQSGPG